MPASSPIRDRTSSAVGEDTGSANYRQAESVVAASGSLKEAVVNSPFLDGFDESHRVEVIAVLDALPADVDQAFMASLRDALAAKKKIAFKWRAGEFSHEATEADGTVTLVLQCPSGESFTK